MEEVVIPEKENGEEEESQRRRPLRNMTCLELREFKKEVRSKLKESEGVFTKLDDGFENLKLCIVKMTSVIEECQNLVKAESRESKDLQYVLRDTTVSTACRTNIVSPMVGGIPLKKARITLKRLGPAPYYITGSGTSVSSQSPAPDASSRTSQSGSDLSEAGPSTSRGRRRL